MADFPVLASPNFVPQVQNGEVNLLWKTALMLYVGLGLTGSVPVNDTAAHSGLFWIFHAKTTAVIAAITYRAGTTGGAVAGDTIQAGDRIYGWITSLTLTSGTGELYNAGSQ